MLKYEISDELVVDTLAQADLFKPSHKSAISWFPWLFRSYLVSTLYYLAPSTSQAHGCLSMPMLGSYKTTHYKTREAKAAVQSSEPANNNARTSFCPAT